MKFNNPYWTLSDKISLLQRWILVTSYLYYELDVSIVSDDVYDNNAKQLASLLEVRSALDNGAYDNAFKDYDPSTGFDLYNKLSNSQKLKIKEEAERIKNYG